MSNIIRFGGGGDKINGIVSDYLVGAGETISAGDFVSFIDNTSVQKSRADNITNGAIVAFNAVNTLYISAVALDSSRVLVSYQNNTTFFGNSVVLTITGTTITVGAIVAFNAVSTSYISAVALDSSRVLVSYRNTSGGYGNALVLTISGTTITVGAIVAFNAVNTSYISAVALDSSRVLVSYQNATAYIGNSVVLTISGTTIAAVGAVVVFSAVDMSYISAVALDSSRVLVSYRNTSASGYGNSVVLTITGTTITVGTIVAFNAVSTSYISAVALDSSRVLVSYQNNIPNIGNSVVLDLFKKANGVAKTAGTQNQTIQVIR